MRCPDCRAKLAESDEEMTAHLRRNAEKGYSWAQCILGVHYRKGLGVRRSGRQAERWFRAAMEDRDWKRAAVEGRDSLWYRQVTNRAERLMTRMEKVGE